MKITRSSLTCWTILFAAVGLLGCKGSAKPPEVSGKVTVNGAPAASGATVVFVGSDGKEMQALVRDDGSYVMSGPPLGQVKVAVKPAPTSAPTVKMEGGMPGMGAGGAKGEAVPPKYADANNGLTYNVVGGKQTFDIKLTN